MVEWEGEEKLKSSPGKRFRSLMNVHEGKMRLTTSDGYQREHFFDAPRQQLESDKRVKSVSVVSSPWKSSAKKTLNEPTSFRCDVPFRRGSVKNSEKLRV